MERMDEKHELNFLDIAVYVDEQRKAYCKCYQKPTDTGTILNFPSSPPAKRNIVEVTIPRIF